MIINFRNGVYIYAYIYIIYIYINIYIYNTVTLTKTNIYLDVNRLSIARSTNGKVVRPIILY